MPSSAIDTLLAALEGALAVSRGKVTVKDPARLRAKVDVLAQRSALGHGAEQGAARWLIWEAAQALGLQPASINGLYVARGAGRTPVNFTVPAMNLRAITFDCARAAFRAAARIDAAAMLFEIARSEIGYTDQRPAEYTASILAAAIKEGYTGPVFVQGDHFQVNAKKYAKDPEAEVQAVRDIITEGIAGGFYNIDVDTSTLVDLSRAAIAEQQALNYGRCAELTAFIRGLEPKGVTVSVGGEIGEVGGKNSTETELRAFLDGYRADLLDRPVNGKKKRGGPPGISKISIQTGTSHGGVVLPDGSIADVAVDFDVLRRLSIMARKEYGLAGAVQHGASTLPETAFGKFPECEACEVHLATNFQNMLYDRLPADLRAEIYDWLRVNAADERKPSDTDEQFFYKSRKKAVGPFKAKTWGLPEAQRAEIGAAWEKQFGFLFEKLNIAGTRRLVEQHVDAAVLHRRPEDFGAGDKAGEDVLLLKGAPDKKIWPNKYNGLGGHIERGESPAAAAAREIREESGLEARGLRLRGVVTIDAGESAGIALYVFTAMAFERSVTASGEGSLEWIRASDADRLDLVEDLPTLLPVVLGSAPAAPPFSAHYSYDKRGRLQIRFDSAAP